jgi:glycine/D-amino acid oxidase-like deaminating enzyme
MTDTRYDVLVIGGGLIGAAVAFGLLRKKLKVAIVDQGDNAHRAARGNFGLVWVQSKGSTFRPYAALSRRSAEIWPQLAAELRDVSGVDVGFQQAGGITFCHSEAEFAQRAEFMCHQFDADLPYPDAYRMLEREETARLVPAIGPRVVGASYCRLDGCANSLRLLRALHVACQKLGGRYLPGIDVAAVSASQSGFTVSAAAGPIAAERVVLAAGLGNARLAPSVGLDTPVKPLRGQILVTEKTAPLLTLPTHLIRQMDEGTVILGDSQEDVGFDDGTELGVLGTIAERARTSIPALAKLRVVRAWGALRVMSPDGFPLYQQSAQHRGAFAFSVHSGVTLAPVHAYQLADAVALGTLPETLAPFNEQRLALQAA